MQERMIKKALEMAEVFSIKGLQCVAIIIIGLIGIKIFTMIVDRILKKSKIDLSLHKFIKNMISVLFWIIIAISIFGVLGINTASLVTVLGAAGAAIALALRDSLANIAGGIIIIITKPFKMGDYVDLLETAGVVQEIDLLCTTLKTFDNRVITVPNGKITTSILINATTEATRRVDFIFSLSYDEDLKKAKQALIKLALDNEKVFSDPEPFFGIANHNERKVQVDFRVWGKTEDYWEIKYYIEENVKKAFDEAGINMPFPYLEIVSNKKQ